MKFKTFADFLKWKSRWAKKKVARLKDGILSLDGIQIQIENQFHKNIRIEN